MTPHAERHQGIGQSGVDGSPAGARIVCISTDATAGAALREVVLALLPEASVSVADTSILRGAPVGDCAVLSVGELYAAVPALLQDLRARGFAGGIVLVAESAQVARELEGAAIARYGVRAVVGARELTETLPAALHGVFADLERGSRSSQGASILASLQRIRGVIAAGEMARALRHRLNNPLAALLAEAQLLELEPLSPEHASSVSRIVESCRRVIEVTRSIEEIEGGGAP